MNEQNIIIYISIAKFLWTLATISLSAVGIISAIISFAWYLSGRLTKVETKVDNFDARLGTVETLLGGNLGKLFAKASPLKLLPKGEKILIDSGLKEYSDKHKESILAECKKLYSKDNKKNPYDIQLIVFDFFRTMNFEEKFNDNLKIVAFNNGVDLGVVRQIGAIYFRDICLEAEGFKPEDLDKPKA